jgi:hypothetical protein
MLISILLLSSLQPLTVRVDGEGYIRLMAEGRHVFTKKCSLVVTGGRLAAADGPALLPTIPVPGDPTSMKIGLDGTVTASYPTGERTLGRIVLGDFPADVRPVRAGNYYVCYGKPDLGNPGEGTFGILRTEGAKTEASVVTAPKTAILTITVKPTADVDADQLTLGDVVEGLSAEVAELDLGTVPPIGVSRTVSRVQIGDRLKRAGYKNQQIQFSGAVTATVSRTGQSVSDQQFVEAAQIKAKQELGAEVVPTTSAPTMAVPKGKVELVVEGSQASGLTSKVTVAVYVNGQRFNSRVVGFRGTAKSAVTLTVGQSVDVLVKKGSLSVQTKGTVKRVDKNQVTVEVEPSKAQVVGTVNALGQVEVSA